MSARAAALAVSLWAAAAVADEVGTDGTTRLSSSDDEVDGPSRGPRDAVVTVEFFCNYAHFQCIHGERALHRLLERHPDSVRIVYHLVVLPFHDSEEVAAATLEAWRQGRPRPGSRRASATR